MQKHHSISNAEAPFNQQCRSTIQSPMQRHHSNSNAKAPFNQQCRSTIQSPMQTTSQTAMQKHHPISNAEAPFNHQCKPPAKQRCKGTSLDKQLVFFGSLRVALCLEFDPFLMGAVLREDHSVCFAEILLLEVDDKATKLEDFTSELPIKALFICASMHNTSKASVASRRSGGRQRGEQHCSVQRTGG